MNGFCFHKKNIKCIFVQGVKKQLKFFYQITKLANNTNVDITDPIWGSL